MILLFKIDSKDIIYLDSCCGISVIDKKDLKLNLNKEKNDY